MADPAQIVGGSQSAFTVVMIFTVEAEYRNGAVAAIAHRLTAVTTADRMAGILQHRKTVALS